MSRPRVLHLCASRAFSGAEAVACSIIQGLHAEYEGVYGSPPGAIREAVESRGIRFEPLGELNARAVSELISRVEPDVVHAHDYTASLLAAVAGRGLPVVSHIHLNNPLMRKFNARSLAFGLSMRRFSRIVVVDQAVIDEHVLRAALKRRAVVASNFVDIPQVVERASGGKATPVQLLFVGRLTPQKDPIGFLQIVKEVLQRMGTVTAAMVGEGEMSEEVHAARREMGLEECVEMRGFQSNPYSHIAAADVVVMPSLWEGFGLVAVETMALGTPLVVRPVGGLEHVVGDSEGALVGGTVDDLAAAACRLLEDSGLRERTGTAGRERAAFFGDKERFLGTFRTVYEDGLTRRKD